MKRGSEHSKKAKQILAPLLGAALVTYFAYHAVQGDRGLLAWWQLRHQLEAAQTDLVAIQDERAKIEHKISLLRPESLDRDMLDEQTRRVLAFGQPNELLIIPTN